MTQDDLNEIIKDMEANYDEVGVNGESCLTTAHIKRILEDYIIKNKTPRLTAKLENGRICLIGMNEDNADKKVIAACKKLFDYEEVNEPKAPILRSVALGQEFGLCPRCCAEVKRTGVNDGHCGACGQKLDWR